MKLVKCIITGVVGFLMAAAPAAAKDLVILHTNDTHSLIEPGADGMGGVLQRKAVIDSVRAAEKNVILVDAGDIVQGTLYFKYFRGDVEYPLMNMMGYDIQILGNHEFDNGLDELADHYRTLKAKRLSANYEVSETPLKGLLEPYTIRKVDGKKVGFIGINIDPESLISKQNYTGLVYRDAIEEANRTAALLKEKGCDLIVAVTHIGYETSNDKPTDVDLAKASKDIDIIIGGHSHTLLKPEASAKPHLFTNAEGRPVLVVQTGKSGRYLGYIKIDLDDLKKETPADFDYRLIPVSDRFPAEKLDRKMAAFLEPYKQKVDSVNSHVIAKSLYELSNRDHTGGFPNWVGDYAAWYGRLVTDSLRAEGVDIEPLSLGLMNVGGIRSSWAKGDVTEGQVLSTFPFANRMVITRVKGSDLLDVLRASARKGGEAVSDEVLVVTDGDGNLVNAYIDMEPIEPERYYNVSTIDYVAQGNDDLTGFANGEVIWTDPNEMVVQVLRYVELLNSMGLPIAPDTAPRFLPSAK